MSKYEKTVLPTAEKAWIMSEERIKWAEQARGIDRIGSAKEFELTALLLRYYHDREVKKIL